MNERKKFRFGEIMFRGKKHNGEWGTGYLHKKWFSNLGIADVIQVIYDDGIVDYMIDPATIGQCTGLYDKNGTLIFEGDIVHSGEKGDAYSVYWNTDELAWYITAVDDFVREFGDIPLASIGNRAEVIGNIWVGQVQSRNTELLKGGEDDGT